jgi:hypothetical protein
MNTFTDARKEQFPQTTLDSFAQGIGPSIPSVEITHHAHPLGIGSPYGKLRAGHTINNLQLRTQLLV